MPVGFTGQNRLRDRADMECEEHGGRFPSKWFAICTRSKIAKPRAEVKHDAGMSREAMPV